MVTAGIILAVLVAGYIVARLLRSGRSFDEKIEKLMRERNE